MKGKETEAKFLVENPSVQRRIASLHSLGSFRLIRRQSERQQNIYWDTPDLRLRRAQAALKVRRVGSRAEMTVRFFQPASVDTPLECEAWIASEKGRLYGMEAVAKTSKGRLIAQATTKCVRVR